MCGHFDGIWDCNALVAVNVENRQKFIDLLVSLLKPGGKILLTIHGKFRIFAVDHHSQWMEKMSGRVLSLSLT